MPNKRRPEDSQALQIMKLTWEHSMHETGHSWTRLNGALRGILCNIIVAGVPFGEGDFDQIALTMRIGYWFGDDGGESFYTLACQWGNLSACKSFERWKEREALILHGVRLCVGAQMDQNLRERPQIDHKGKNDSDWYVTSFKSADAVNLTRYRHEEYGTTGHFRTKVAGRRTLNRAQITEAQRLVSEAKKARKAAAEKETVDAA